MIHTEQWIKYRLFQFSLTTKRTTGTFVAGIPELVDLYLETGKREGMPAAFRSFLKNASTYADLIASFANVEVPVLSIRGESDWLPVSERDAFVANIKHVEQVTIEGSGHFASQEVPEKVIENVKAFLN